MARAIPAWVKRRFEGFLMPAEWEPHLATYMVWPHNRDTWPDKFEPVPAAFAAIVAGLSRFEAVRLLVKDEEVQAEAQRLLSAAGAILERIDFVPLLTNDSWIRDFGPIFVNRAGRGETAAEQVALDFTFNSWGNKYGSTEFDDPVPRRLGARYGLDSFEIPMVLEGGSIDVNGRGSLLTSEACLLNPNRNPELSRREIEEYLAVFLGARNVLWLGEGIIGDDTDGHIDDLARFVDPTTIVTVIEEDPADPNHRLLQDALARLKAMRDQAGRPFQIETLPMPPALFCQDQRLPASYANFYIANGAVLMPTFGCPSDRQALACLARLFPTRQVLGFPCLDLVWGRGTIHCLTQQHPLF